MIFLKFMAILEFVQCNDRHVFFFFFLKLVKIEFGLQSKLLIKFVCNNFKIGDLVDDFSAIYGHFKTCTM